MIYKIMQGLVAIPLPPYFEQRLRMTRHNHPLALHQLQTAANYYKFSFFPSAVICWNRLPAQAVLLPTLDQFGCKTTTLYNTTTTVFKLLIHVLLTLLSFSVLCIVTVRRNPPAGNPHEGVMQYQKKERVTFVKLMQKYHPMSSS